MLPVSCMKFWLLSLCLYSIVLCMSNGVWIECVCWWSDWSRLTLLRFDSNWIDASFSDPALCGLIATPLSLLMLDELPFCVGLKLFAESTEGVSPPRSISCSKLSMCATPIIFATSICWIICHVIDWTTGNSSRISPKRPRESYSLSLI